MQDDIIVRDLEVLDRGRTVKASYFVEAGILHATIGGRNYRLPVGSDGSEEIIQRMLLGQIRNRTWRERFLDRWRSQRQR